MVLVNVCVTAVQIAKANYINNIVRGRAETVGMSLLTEQISYSNGNVDCFVPRYL